MTGKHKGKARELTNDFYFRGQFEGPRTNVIEPGTPDISWLLPN